MSLWGKPVFIMQQLALLPNPVTPPAPLPVIYNGQTQVLHAAGSVPSGTLVYKLDGGPNVWSFLPVSATAVGTYTVLWRVRDGSWDSSTYETPSPLSGSITCTIIENVWLGQPIPTNNGRVSTPDLIANGFCYGTKSGFGNLYAMAEATDAAVYVFRYADRACFVSDTDASTPCPMVDIVGSNMSSVRSDIGLGTAGGGYGRIDNTRRLAYTTIPTSWLDSLTTYNMPTFQTIDEGFAALRTYLDALA